MIYQEDRGIYHFIKLNAVPEIDLLIQRVYSVLDYFNKNNTPVAKLLLSAAVNQIFAIGRMYVHSYIDKRSTERFKNPANSTRLDKIISKKIANRKVIGEAIIYALGKPVDEEMRKMGFLPFSASSPRDNGDLWDTANTGFSQLNIVSHTNTGLYRGKRDLGVYPLFVDNKKMLVNSDLIQNYSGRENFLQNIYRVLEENHRPFDLNFFLPQNVYKRIYAYLLKSEQVSFEVEGKELFLYFAKFKEVNSLPIINFSINSSGFKFGYTLNAENQPRYKAAFEKYLTETNKIMVEQFDENSNLNLYRKTLEKDKPLLDKFESLVKKETEGTITPIERNEIFDIRHGKSKLRYIDNIAFQLIEAEYYYKQLIKQ